MKCAHTATRLQSALLIAATLVSLTCRRDGTPGHTGGGDIARPIVSANGEVITFAEGYPGLQRIETQSMSKEKGTITVTAPAKIIASIRRDASGHRVVLFESQELTSLYAQYQQALINSGKASRALSRVRDMYEGQMVTRKEVSESESEAAATSAVAAEMEARMRAFGINPREIGAVKSDTVWLIADVPETQMSDLRRGQAVTISLAALRSEKTRGKADAVGDNVDPLTRTVKVRISMNNERHRFKPGMFAQVDFGETKSKLAALPSSAVVTVENQNYVFVKTGTYEFTRVAVVASNSIGPTIGIVSGINSGDEVVVKGAILLKGLSFGY